MKAKLSRKQRLILILVLAALFTGWIVWGNSALMTSTYTVESPRLPAFFSGFRIAQVSDLHNAEFGEDNGKLLQLLEASRPDIIAITGDLVDSRRTDIDVALAFVREAVKIAPTYYVTGNHESRIEEYAALKSGLEQTGAVVLEDAAAVLERDGETIRLLGLNDPSFATDSYLFAQPAEMVSSKLRELSTEEDAYTVLLSHRPELFETYARAGIDLALSGHAHGGQVRLPFLGGLIAPNQGLFPEYDAGLYSSGNTSMVVSRGLGNSLFPFRVNNRPELVLVELLAG